MDRAGFEPENIKLWTDICFHGKVHEKVTGSFICFVNPFVFKLSRVTWNRWLFLNDVYLTSGVIVKRVYLCGLTVSLRFERSIMGWGGTT